jgi:toxin ParE1/3/4
VTDRGYRLSTAARADAEEILPETIRRFGTAQRRSYQALSEKTAGLVAAAPDRAGSRSRQDLRPKIRSFAIERASARRGAAAQVLYYVANATKGVLIIRILNGRMDPSRHIALSLS